MDNTGGAPERERKGIKERRERVLDAAKVVFARSGYDAATVDEIAELAKVGKGTVYRLCGDKRRLLHAVTHRAADSLLVEFASAFKPQDDPPAKLRKIIAVLCEWYEQNLDLAKVLFLALHSPKKESGEHNHDHPILNLLETIIKEGRREGFFAKSLNPKLAPEILFHLLTPSFYEEMKARFAMSRKRIAGHVFELLYKGFAG